MFPEIEAQTINPTKEGLSRGDFDSHLYAGFYMEQGNGLSADTIDSTASSRDQQEISTGFSATAPDAEPQLANSAFHDRRLDAQLDLEYAEFDGFGSQSNLWSHVPSSKIQISVDHRPRTSLLQNYGGCGGGGITTTDTNFLPVENVYNNVPFFPFSSAWGTTALNVGKSQPSESDHSVLPKMMASKFLDMQARRQICMKTGSSSVGNVDLEVSPPAEKRRRSAMRTEFKHEYPQTTAFPSFIAESRTVQWMEKGKAIGVRGVQGGSTVTGTRELYTMEQLLVQCAAALETRDITQAQQTIFVINNIAAVDGDPNQRLLAYFLRALLLRASKFVPHLLNDSGGCLLRSNKLKTTLELTNYIDIMPWYRFGFIAANGAILDAFAGKEKVHILDFNVSHCMQWPTLIEALAERSDGPPQVRLTVCVSKSPIPPLLDVSYDELLLRLANFARSKSVPFEYELLVEDVENLDISKISLRDDEALAVNCLLRLHYVSEECDGEQVASSTSPRDQVLRFIRNLNPAIVTLAEEDANLTLPKMVPRLRAAFNYLWIPFDALHTLLPTESYQRQLYEDEVASKIENVVACEGRHRRERVETKDLWVQRMRRARFEMVPFSDDVVADNKLMLGEHSGCWGLRKDEDEEVLGLNWKGHTVSFATAWVPVDHLPL